MTIQRGTRLAALALMAAVTLTVSACSGDQAPRTTNEAVTVTATSSGSAPAEAETAAAAAAPTPQPRASSVDGAPCEASGYTAEAEDELRDENVSKDEVADVLARACVGEGETEWDDDGYWEIEVGEIDVDVFPDGVVRDVDR